MVYDPNLMSSESTEAVDGTAASFIPKQPTAASDLVMMDAVPLQSSIHTRKASCVEVMTAYLDHIERINPKVNAIVALQDRAELLAQAVKQDTQLARGKPVGPLHGFPLAVKDLQPVNGIRTTQGSPIFRDFVPSADSLVVERMRRAGAIFIGKTNMPEFGLGSHTRNPVYGVTRNAYDQSRSAGGSSGGAGVALALRMVPIADGTDYGGSLRNPAGWNNVFGFRPSIGRVPTDARDLWLPSMSVTGPMARTVADLAMLLSVLAGYDPRAPLSIDGGGGPFGGCLEQDVKGKQIAWAGDFNGHTPCEPGVLEVCKTALKTFESLGCIVEEALPDYPPDAVWRAFMQIRSWEQGARLLAHYNDPGGRALLNHEAIFEVKSGMKLSAFDLASASVVRSQWYQALCRLFERCDCLIVPTAQLFPFDIEMHWPQEIAGQRMETYHEWMKAACLITMSGCPALAAPAGFSGEGLPIGIQIVAPNRREASCLQFAHAYQLATDWTYRRLPPLLL